MPGFLGCFNKIIKSLYKLSLLGCSISSFRITIST
nr:MAG TPA: hypothetical protein [Caudoviricetes sp.]